MTDTSELQEELAELKEVIKILTERLVQKDKDTVTIPEYDRRKKEFNNMMKEFPRFK